MSTVTRRRRCFARDATADASKPVCSTRVWSPRRRITL